MIRHARYRTRDSRAMLETLESRQLLSASPIVSQILAFVQSHQSRPAVVTTPHPNPVLTSNPLLGGSNTYSGGTTVSAGTVGSTGGTTNRGVGTVMKVVGGVLTLGSGCVNTTLTVGGSAQANVGSGGIGGSTTITGGAGTLDVTGGGCIILNTTVNTINNGFYRLLSYAGNSGGTISTPGGSLTLNDNRGIALGGGSLSLVAGGVPGTVAVSTGAINFNISNASIVFENGLTPGSLSAATAQVTVAP